MRTPIKPIRTTDHLNILTFSFKKKSSQVGTTEEAIANAEKNNREMIDSVSDAIFEVNIDGNILFLSEAWRRITGFEVERSKGSDLFSMLFPEDQQKQKQDFEGDNIVLIQNIMNKFGLTVREIENGKYELISGGRRFEAIKKLADKYNKERFKNVPVFIKDINSESEVETYP